MARLHLRFKKKSFDPRIIELTDRFFKMREEMPRWLVDDFMAGRLYDTWLHGACIVYELPFPSLNIDTKQAPPKGKPGVGRYDHDSMTITLVRFSAISLFHQFRHHMQAHAAKEWDHEADGQDAQEWACSLFYQTDKSRFRKWVRRGRVAGVHPPDLLKRRRAS